MLNAEQIIADAQAQTGLTDMGEPDIREGLEIVVDALNTEGNLRPDGVEAQRMALTGKIVNRLILNEIVTTHPEIRDEKIKGPVVIVGLPRTGTTKLQKMLATNPEFQWLPLWRVMSPAPLGPRPEGGVDPRITIAEQASAGMKEHFPDFFAGHPMLPLEPEEEIWMQDLTMRGSMPCFIASMPSYREWGMAQDVRPWYAFLHMVLQMFQWQDGTQDKTWLLKAPDHMGNLDLLFEVFPEATIVQTHRDPVTAIASIAVLSAASRRMYTDDADPHEAGDFSAGIWSDKLRRLVLQREQMESEHAFVDVPYRDVVGDLMGVIDQIHATAGVPLSDETRAAMRRWEADNPQGKHGTHKYDLAEVGLEEEQVRALFAPYLERFAPMIEE